MMATWGKLLLPHSIAFMGGIACWILWAFQEPGRTATGIGWAALILFFVSLVLELDMKSAKRKEDDDE